MRNCDGRGSRLLFAAALLAGFSCNAQDILIYVGTYTGPESKGIYSLHFDSHTGKLSGRAVAAETESPSFVALHPSGKYLYAVNEIDQFQGQKGGAVTAFRIEPGGALTQLNQVSTRGAGPCHVSVDHTGKMVMVANYTGGSVAAFRVLDDGRLSEATSFDQHKGTGKDPQRQEGPHGHCVVVSPDNKYVVSADLGLDRLFVYRLNPATGTFTANGTPYSPIDPGSGPRHVAFDTNRPFAYAINEMASTITALRYDAKAGTLTSMQTVSTLPQGASGENSTAEIVVHPNGKFVYGSNRGNDSIAVFAIDQKTGTLTVVHRVPTGGKEPRSFAIDPSGAWLIAANQNSNTLTVFRIDAQTGRLTATGESAEVTKPVCVQFMHLK